MTEVTPEDIRTVRRLRGWTQAELAAALGLAHKQSISDAERGRQALNPTAAMLVTRWRDEYKAAGEWPEEGE